MGTSSCRLAGDPLKLVADFGHPFVSDFVDPGTSTTVGRRFPLQLGLGPQSRLLQLMQSPPPDSLYRRYWYRSGMNESMRAHLADVVEQAIFWTDLAEGDLVCDIGCNDGTLLSAWRALHNVLGIGFDPATNLGTAALARSERWTFINDYFSADLYWNVAHRKAKVVTSIAMFYDLDSPRAFVADVARILHEQGVWICEMQYLPLILHMNAFDAICAEHVAYYSLLAFEKALRGSNLKVQKISLNPTNGGTFRVFVTHRNQPLCPSLTPSQAAIHLHELAATRAVEEQFHLGHPATYTSFMERVDARGEALRSRLAAIQAAGQTVGGYGASTKGNTLLQYWRITPELLPWIAERDESKWGKVTVGTEIPIIPELEMRAKKPDYLLALPWHFGAAFLNREAALVQQGTRFLFPLPDVTTLPR